MKLSIIIPIYNVEKYLETCLKSALGIDLPSEEFEVIAVNDGSPDGSSQILEEYKDKYPNLVIVNKINGGLSSARNAGLEVARGDYIWFVDGDDWIDTSVQNVMSFVDAYPKVDVFALCSHTVTEEGNYIERISRTLQNEANYDGLAMYKSLNFPFSGVPFYLWKHSFLQDEGLKFKEGALYDDWQFLLRAFSLMNGCVYLNEALYYYRLRGNTISNASKSFRHLHDCVETAVDYSRCLENASLNSRSVFMLNSGICKMVADAYKIIFLRIQDKEEQKKCLRYFFTKKIWLHAIIRARSYKSLIRYIMIRIRGGICL